MIRLCRDFTRRLGAQIRKLFRVSLLGTFLERPLSPEVTLQMLIMIIVLLEKPCKQLTDGVTLISRSPFSAPVRRFRYCLRPFFKALRVISLKLFSNFFPPPSGGKLVEIFDLSSEGKRTLNPLVGGSIPPWRALVGSSQQNNLGVWVKSPAWIR